MTLHIPYFPLLCMLCNHLYIPHRFDALWWLLDLVLEGRDFGYQYFYYIYFYVRPSAFLHFPYYICVHSCRLNLESFYYYNSAPWISVFQNQDFATITFKYLLLFFQKQEWDGSGSRSHAPTSFGSNGVKNNRTILRISPQKSSKNIFSRAARGTSEVVAKKTFRYCLWYTQCNGKKQCLQRPKTWRGQKLIYNNTVQSQLSQKKERRKKIEKEKKEKLISRFWAVSPKLQIYYIRDRDFQQQRRKRKRKKETIMKWKKPILKPIT